MDENAYFEQEYTNVDFSQEPIVGAEFNNCTFINCNFSNCKLDNTDFLDCRFESCSFIMVHTHNTGFKEVKFEGCKLVGLDFSLCNDFLFKVEFENCQLDYALFTKKKLRKTKFQNCSVKEADFTQTDLSHAIFGQTDLTDSVFEGCNLEETDFRTAINFTIDPDQNRIKGARFSSYALAGLLRKYDLDLE